jgi:hypothetical protein
MPALTGNMVIGSGGYVLLRWTGQSQGVRVDVTDWFLAIMPINVAMTHSGCGGTITRKAAALDWKGGVSVPYFDKAGDPTGILTKVAIGSEIRIEFVQNNGDIYKGMAVVDSFSTRASSGPDAPDINVITCDILLSCAGPLELASGGPDTTQKVNLNSGTVPMVNTRV